MRIGQSGWITLGLLGVVGLGAGWAQITIPDADQLKNLTQTIRSSWIVDDGGTPVIKLHDGTDARNLIDIPTGALRDGSIVSADIDRSRGGVDADYDCGSQMLVGIDADGAAVCGAVPTALWSSRDRGQQSVYFSNTNSVGADVYVGSSPSQRDSSFGSSSDGLAASGSVVMTGSLVWGADVLELVAPASPAQLRHARPLVVGSPLPRPDYGFGQQPSVGVGLIDPQEVLDVGGRAIVDGKLLRKDDTHGKVSSLSYLSNGGSMLLTSLSSTSTNDMQIDAPRLVVGGRQSSTSVVSDAVLDVRGDAAIVHGAGIAPVTLGEFGADVTTAVGTLSHTGTVSEQCTALSLDARGEVVLVNICDIETTTPPPTPTYARSCSAESSTTAGACSGTYTTTDECRVRPGENDGGYCSGPGSDTQGGCETICRNDASPTIYGFCGVANSDVSIRMCDRYPGSSQSCSSVAQSDCQQTSGTYASCTWTPPSTNTTQTVVCKDNNNNTVADSFCTGTKPAASSVCTDSATYTRYTGDWGTCSAASPTCTGTYPTTQETDRNDTVFDWNDVILYAENGQPYYNCGAGDLSVNQNVNTNANNGTACISIEGSTYAGTMYKPSPSTNNTWDKVTVSTDGTITAIEKSVGSLYARASCSAVPQSSCEQTSGTYATCTWNNSLSTKTRTVECRNSAGATVADSFCTGTKPAASSVCSTSANADYVFFNLSTTPGASCADAPIGTQEATYVNNVCLSRDMIPYATTNPAQGNEKIQFSDIPTTAVDGGSAYMGDGCFSDASWVPSSSDAYAVGNYIIANDFIGGENYTAGEAVLLKVQNNGNYTLTKCEPSSPPSSGPSCQPGAGSICACQTVQMCNETVDQCMQRAQDNGNCV